METKMTFKEIVAYEKTQMLPLNYFISYILVPIYCIISGLLVMAALILLEIDDEKFLLPGLLCMGFTVILTVAILLIVPYVRKETIKTELKRYFLNTDGMIAQEVYDYSRNDYSLKFNKFGMYVNDRLYYYNHLSIRIVTSNYCKRILIGVMFCVSENQTVTLQLEASVLKMLDAFHIPLENQAVLDYILSNKKDAFLQIFNNGHIKPK